MYAIDARAAATNSLSSLNSIVYLHIDLIDQLLLGSLEYPAVQLPFYEALGRPLKEFTPSEEG
jgi:hypothetical protein